jgi:hypothetical protein
MATMMKTPQRGLHDYIAESDVNCHQFLVLALVVGFEFRALKLEFGLFRVCL